MAIPTFTVEGQPHLVVSGARYASMPALGEMVAETLLYLQAVGPHKEVAM